MTEPSGKADIRISGSATLRTRTNLSYHHLLAACRFTARIAEVEQANESKPFGAFWEEILHYSLAVAALSVATIECFANELYFEGAILSKSINPAGVEAVAEMIDSESILKKYAVALAIRNGKTLDYGCLSVQNVDVLIKLRNAVIHFKPEWLEEQDRHSKLSKQLQYKFKVSPFFPNESIFPRAWATHDFAAWAIKSTVQFLDYFYAEVELECPINKFKDHLTRTSGLAL